MQVGDLEPGLVRGREVAFYACASKEESAFEGHGVVRCLAWLTSMPKVALNVPDGGAAVVEVARDANGAAALSVVA